MIPTLEKNIHLEFIGRSADEHRHTFFCLQNLKMNKVTAIAPNTSQFQWQSQASVYYMSTE